MDFFWFVDFNKACVQLFLFVALFIIFLLCILHMPLFFYLIKDLRGDREDIKFGAQKRLAG